MAEQSVYRVRSNCCISCVVQLAFESLSVIVNALTLLEVGQVSVYRWDEPDAPTNRIKINWYLSVPACVDCDPGLLMFQLWGTRAASPPLLSTVPRWVGSSHPEALSVPAKKDQNSSGGSHYILKKRGVAKMQSELCVPTDCNFTSMLCSSWKHQQKCFWQRNSRLQVLDTQVRIVAQLFKYSLRCHYLKIAYLLLYSYWDALENAIRWALKCDLLLQRLPSCCLSCQMGGGCLWRGGTEWRQQYEQHRLQMSSSYLWWLTAPTHE